MAAGMAAAAPATRAERIERAKAVRARQWRRACNDVGEFIELVSPKFVRPEHLQDAADQLDLSMRTSVFLLLEAPPRHGKSELVFHHIVRLLKFKPGARIAYVSFSGQMANRKSRRIRQLAADAGIWVGAEKKKGQAGSPAATVTFWQTPGGGFFIAGGRGGGFVGEGFDLIVIDDPFKNRKEAESEVAREEVWELWVGSLVQRLEPGGSAIVMHQRWHTDDLIGRLKEQVAKGGGKPWTLVSKAAVANDVYDDADLLIEGEALWADRYPFDELRKLCAEVTPYNWFSQYQQRPRPRGSQLFGEPARYTAEDALRLAYIAIGADPAATESTANDPSGIVVAAVRGVGLEMQMDILWAEEVWLEIPSLVDRLVDFQTKRWAGAPCVAEAIAGFKAVPQYMARTNQNLRIFETGDTRDKMLRALPVSAAWNQGRVRVPVTADWDVPLLLKRLQAFTGVGGGRDDLVDALAHLWNWCQLHSLGGSRSTSTGGKRAMADSPF